MKVLILHQHLKTPEQGGALRSYYLAQALIAKGITVCFITGWNEKVYQVKDVDGIEVHYLPVAYDNSFGFIKRSISFLHFILASYREAKRIDEVAVCYAISAPLTMGIPALRLRRKKKVPFVFEVGDLWPEAPIQLGFVRNPLFISILYHLEKWIYRKADSIVALSKPIEDSIAEKVPGKKIHLIPNMADCDFFSPAIQDDVPDQLFTVSYIGATGIANGLDYFIECARNAAKADLPIHFNLCGDGAQLEHLKSSAQKLNLRNITFTGLINRQLVKEILLRTHAIFVCYKNVPVLETGSPNKYFDGLAAGKLIVVNFGGWIKNEIEEASCGVALDPKHPTDFIKKIQPFVFDRDLLRRHQVASRQLAEKKYSRSRLSNSFAAIFQNYA